jgi:D-alanyl-D-alanine carboxypeptidase
MGVESAGPSLEASRATRTSRYLVPEIREQLEAVVAAGVAGAAVVAVGPGGRIEEAAGVADLVTGEPLTAAHRFRIGSVTKIFVATLVLQLVADGLLALDGDAAPFVDGVTVRQLLNHTSGLDDFMDDPIAFFEPYRHDPGHRWELDARQELALVLAKPRLFPPGEGWAYRGANYLALRLLAEDVLGIPLRDALRERVLAPLGLELTDLVEGPLLGVCARGYLPPDNPILPGGPGPVDVTELDLPFYRAGGGIVSTAGEVATLLRALLAGELLASDLRTQMLDAVESDWPETDRYGLGIGEITTLMRRERSPCGPAWGHLGFSLGYIAIALSSADGERQVVICANGQPTTEPDEDAFFDAAGRLAWRLYCL